MNNLDEKIDDLKEKMEIKAEEARDLAKAKWSTYLNRLWNFDKKTFFVTAGVLGILISLSFLCLAAALIILTLKGSDTASKLAEIYHSPKSEIHRELEVREAYERAGKLFFDAYSSIENTLRIENQAQDRLTSESFVQVYEQSYAGFNQGIGLAEQILKDYPGYYYHDKLLRDGLLVGGDYYSIDRLKEIRNTMMENFTRGRGAAMAALVLEECKIIDRAAAQFASTKTPHPGKQIVWSDIAPYLPPFSRLSLSDGVDVFGNPFILGKTGSNKSAVTVSMETYRKFIQDEFDWGRYGPEGF